MLHRLFTLALFMGWLTAVPAQTTYTFDGGVFVSMWDNPATWLPNGVPGPDDTVIIDVQPGTNSALMFHDTFTVGTLWIRSYYDFLGSGLLIVADSMRASRPGNCFIDMALATGARAVINDDDYSGPEAYHVFNKAFTIDGELVSDAAAVSIVEGRINGKVTVKQGVFLGHCIVLPSGLLTLDAPGDTLSLGRLTNKGTLTWKNGDLKNTKKRFINEGLWQLNASGGTIYNDSTHIDSLFVNAGTLQASSVKLFTHFVNSGTIAVQPDAVLTMESGLHYHGGAFLGGTLRLHRDSSVAYASVPSSGLKRFELIESFLNVFEPFDPADTLSIVDAFAAGIGSLTVGGHLEWRGGTLSVPVHVFPGATADIAYGQLPPIAGASFFNEGEVVQNGAFFIENDCVNADLWSILDGQPAGLAGNGSFQNHGSVALCGDASGSLTFNIPVTNHASGRFEGDGTITFGMGLSNLGVTDPGCSIGTLTITNGFDTGAGVTLDVEGVQSGMCDRLVAFGSITASGTLRIETPSGFILSDTIDVIHTTGGFNGVFDEFVAPPNYKVIYRPDGVSVAYTTTVSTVATDAELPWRLYPTLAAHEVVLETSHSALYDQPVRIVDAYGRTIRTLLIAKGSEKTIVPVADLQAGMYQVQIVNGKKIENFKFVKI